MQICPHVALWCSCAVDHRGLEGRKEGEVVIQRKGTHPQRDPHGPRRLRDFFSTHLYSAVSKLRYMTRLKSVQACDQVDGQ